MTTRVSAKTEQVDSAATVSVNLRRIYAAGIIATAAIGYLILGIWVWPFTMDDAFISFRYSMHIGDGIGPIWNLADADNPVEGFTSFLHIWTLGILRYISGVDMVLIGKLFSLTAGLVLLGVVALEVQKRRLTGLSAVLALSVFILPFTALHSVSGMETTFFMLWNFLAAMSAVRALAHPSPRAIWVFVLLGLLGTTTRPEFALPFLLMAAYVWWQRPAVRKELAKALIVLYIAPGLAMTGWRYHYYGDIVPNPFHVKQDGELNKFAIIHVARFYFILALPYLLFIATRLRWLWTHQRDLLAIVALSVVPASLYFTTVVPLMDWWFRFLIPQLPLLAILAGVALQNREMPARRSFTLLRGAAIGLIPLIALSSLPLILWWMPNHYQNELRYREVGQRLRPLAADDRWLSYHDVGALVYESEWNTFDVVGLNTRRKGTSECKFGPDVILKTARFQYIDIPTPCNGAYVAVADLPFMRHAYLDSYMRVFVRDDISYVNELREGLINGWPQQFTRQNEWLAWYWLTFYRLFVQWD